MVKLFFNILSALFLLVSIVSCNSEKKVYESTGTAKKKRFEITLGKFNKLVKSGDMEAKYAAALNTLTKKIIQKRLRYLRS